MRPRWMLLNEQEKEAFRAALVFLENRLEERATINWALRLKPDDKVKQYALIELLSSSNGRKIDEPWRTAWHLIGESWSSPVKVDRTSMGVYDVKQRLRVGERTGGVVNSIVALVLPRLELKPFSDYHLTRVKLPKRPRAIDDLFSATLTSGKILDLSVLKLEDVSEKSFLLSLAFALDSAVMSGIDLAKRIGWDGEHRYWIIGRLNRAYYVPADQRVDNDGEPDEFSSGIAPSVKLLHEVVSRLADLDINTAIEFARRWEKTETQIHLRLWTALSRDPKLVPAAAVETFLLSLNDRHFWEIHTYPEIAELRARRFNELSSKSQLKIAARIHKGPPRKHWPKNSDANLVASARESWAVRELRRIEIAGGQIPEKYKSWLDEKQQDHPELLQMDRIDEGFLDTPKATWVQSMPDGRYDLVDGDERLKSLETAFSSKRDWVNDPSGRALDWIRVPEKTAKVLSDLESANGGSAFPRVWERFGWAHSTQVQGLDAEARDLRSEASRVLSLLSALPREIISKSINGISHWMSDWEKHVTLHPEWFEIWDKVWPIAVDATNSQEDIEEETRLNTVVQTSDDQEPRDIDTLNNPAGKLVGVFLAACPKLQPGDQPFASASPLRSMRDEIFNSKGRVLLIAQYRLVEALPYFLMADHEWAQEILIAPLIADNTEAITLWRAISRRTLFSDVIKIIGESMTERAVDKRLGRESRRSLVFSLVIETLHAFRENREPAVLNSRVQQMLRTLDDEVRAYGAEAVQRFVRDLSKPRDDEKDTPSPEQLFRVAAKPLLEQVWPQERSLATPGVSKSFADLPATTGDAFAEAVDAIERFLVPFDCWSMSDYGLYGSVDDELKLSRINNREKASAFLRLLDLTIGTSEGAVVPHELADALDQIRGIEPRLAEDRIFRRLAATTRRG